MTDDVTDDDFDPSDCAGGLCRPGRLPARWKRFDHCVWSRGPGELWWRPVAYCEGKDAGSMLAMFEAREPGAAFAVRPNDAGPPGEDGA